MSNLKIGKTILPSAFKPDEHCAGWKQELEQLKKDKAGAEREFNRLDDLYYDKLQNDRLFSRGAKLIESLSTLEAKDLSIAAENKLKTFDGRINDLQSKYDSNCKEPPGGLPIPIKVPHKKDVQEKLPGFEFALLPQRAQSLVPVAAATFLSVAAFAFRKRLRLPLQWNALMTKSESFFKTCAAALKYRVRTLI